MKHLFVIVFCAGIFLTVCNAACYFEKPELHPEGINECFYKGKAHKFSSEWVTEDCLRCTCLPDGSVSCCEMLDLPMNVESDCEVLKDVKTCTFKIVKKDDHTIEC